MAALRLGVGGWAGNGGIAAGGGVGDSAILGVEAGRTTPMASAAVVAAVEAAAACSSA